MKDAKTCWEFMKCPDKLKESCPAFILSCKNGKKNENYKMYCWDLEGAKAKCKTIGHDDCLTCPWFKKNHKY